MSVHPQDVLAWLDALQQVYADNKAWLTELDAAIGDADHGINLDRGFTAVKAELAKLPRRYQHIAENGGDHPHSHGRRRFGAAIRHVLPASQCSLRRQERAAGE
jgi:hypothetical protein